MGFSKARVAERDLVGFCERYAERALSGTEYLSALRALAGRFPESDGLDKVYHWVLADAGMRYDARRRMVRGSREYVTLSSAPGIPESVRGAVVWVSRRERPMEMWLPLAGNGGLLELVNRRVTEEVEERLCWEDATEVRLPRAERVAKAMERYASEVEKRAGERYAGVLEQRCGEEAVGDFAFAEASAELQPADGLSE